MACCMQNVPKNVGGVQVYNDGDPLPPGTKATCCVCIPLFTYSGIPEGTTRVPEDEEKEILKRWWSGTTRLSASPRPRRCSTRA